MSGRARSISGWRISWRPGMRGAARLAICATPTEWGHGSCYLSGRCAWTSPGAGTRTSSARTRSANTSGSPTSSRSGRASRRTRAPSDGAQPARNERIMSDDRRDDGPGGQPPDEHPGVVETIREEVETLREEIEEVVEHVPQPVRWTVGKLTRLVLLILAGL